MDIITIPEAGAYLRLRLDRILDKKCPKIGERVKFSKIVTSIVRDDNEIRRYQKLNALYNFALAM